MTKLLLALAVLLAALPGGAFAQAPARPAAPAKPPAVSDTLTEATLSKATLRAMYDAAKLPTELDVAGNLTIKVGAVTVYVLADQDRIRLMTSYSFAPRAAHPEQLDIANRINDGYIMVRAAIPPDKPGTITIDHYILVAGGVARAYAVAVTRRFAAVVHEAIDAVDTERLLQ